MERNCVVDISTDARNCKSGVVFILINQNFFKGLCLLCREVYLLKWGNLHLAVSKKLNT